VIFANSVVMQCNKQRGWNVGQVEMCLYRKYILCGCHGRED